MNTIVVPNGPNLNLLGKRQPEIYGHETLDDVERLCTAACPEGFEVRMLQSKPRGPAHRLDTRRTQDDLRYRLQPGCVHAYLDRDHGCAQNLRPPVIEVHISQVHKREAFRHHSNVSLRADGVIAGLGLEGYAAAVRRICQLTSPQPR